MTNILENAQDPLLSFSQLLLQLPSQNYHNQQLAIDRQVSLAKSYGNFGKMSGLASWLASWSQAERPLITKPLLAIFAGNHGLVQNHLPQFDIANTSSQVEKIVAGKALVNQICLANSLSLKVFDLALDLPAGDITSTSSLTPKACAATMAFGMEVIAGGIDLLALGAIGEGNELIAALVCYALYGGELTDWLVDSDSVSDNDLDLLHNAFVKHKDQLQDPLDILWLWAGREFAALVGAILAARMQKVPVILDGFVTSAAAAILHSINPQAIDHCLVGHLQGGAGHALLCRKLDVEPLYELDINSGVGCGAAIATNLVKTAALCHNATIID